MFVRTFVCVFFQPLGVSTLLCLSIFCSSSSSSYHRYCIRLWRTCVDGGICRFRSEGDHGWDYRFFLALIIFFSLYRMYNMESSSWAHKKSKSGLRTFCCCCCSFPSHFSIATQTFCGDQDFLIHLYTCSRALKDLYRKIKIIDDIRDLLCIREYFGCVVFSLLCWKKPARNRWASSRNGFGFKGMLKI